LVLINFTEKLFLTSSLAYYWTNSQGSWQPKGRN